ncbi:MAG: autotransporter-associated beta strand repeat-containing protein, partial [Thermoguttaceae bacterium]
MKTSATWKNLAAAIVVAGAAAGAVPQVMAQTIYNVGTGQTYLTLNALQTAHGTFVDLDNIIFHDATDSTLTNPFAVNDGTLTLSANTADSKATIKPVSGNTTVRFIYDINKSLNLLAANGSTLIFDGFGATNNGQYGGAILGNHLTLGASSGVGSLGAFVFSNNKSYHGGAIYAGGNFSIAGGTNSFTNNSADTSGGAIRTLGNFSIAGGTNSFTNNSAGENGGAIRALGDFSITGGINSFTNNSAGAYTMGGAICAQYEFTLTGGTNSFEGNTTGGYGGAIYTVGLGAALLRATDGDFLFRGNTDSGSSTVKANAMWLSNITGPIHLTLAAEANRKIEFFDPITSLSSSTLTLPINPNVTDTGKIIFDGAYWKGQGITDANYFTTKLYGNATLDYGTLEIKNGAKMDLSGSYTQASTATLGVGIDGTTLALKADSATLAGTLNIVGYDGTAGTVTILETTNDMSTQFATVNIAGQSTADFLSAAVDYSDNKKVKVTTGLTWIKTDGTQHGDFTITDSFTLDVALADATAVSGSWDGKSLTKKGAGTLILTGANIYTGATEINGGTLSVDSAANVGTGTFTLAGGTLNVTGATFNKNIALGTGGGTINNAGAVSIANVISGANALTKTGNGTLTLSGANNYSGATTISAGTLEVTGSLGGGSYAGAISNAGTLKMNQSGNQILSGAISGAGSVVKDGAGTLTLSGANTYTGTTTISAGTLEIGSGGSLTVVADTNAANAPISIAGGAFTVAAGGTLTVDANATQLGALVAGTKTSFYFADTKVGLTVPSVDIHTNINQTLYTVDSYVANDNFIGITRIGGGGGGNRYLSPSVNAAFATYTAGNGNALFDDVHTSPNSEYETAERVELAYNAASGVGASQQGVAALSGFYNVMDNVFAGSFAHGGGGVYRGQVCEPCSPCGTRSRLERAVWVMPVYGHQNAAGLHSGGVKYGYTSDQYAAVFGTEVKSGHTRFGIAGNAGIGRTVSPGAVVYTNSDLTFGGVSLYAVQRFGKVESNAQVGWIGTRNDLRQRNGAVNVNANIDGGVIYAALGFERPYRVGHLTLAPVFGLEFTHLYQNSFATKVGGNAIFSAQSGDANMLHIPLGLKTSAEYATRFGKWSPSVRARVLPHVGDHELAFSNLSTGSTTAATLR